MDDSHFRVQDLFLQGQAHHKAQDYPAAIETYEALLNQVPQHAGTQQMLAIAYSQIHQIEPAEAHFNIALKLEPDNPMLHHNFAQFKKRQGHFTEAKHHFEHALKLKADFYLAHTALSELLESQGHIYDAIYHAKESLRLHPHQQQVLLKLGLLYEAHFQPEMVLSTLGLYQKIYGEHPQSLRAMQLAKAQYNHNQQRSLQAEPFTATDDEPKDLASTYLDLLKNTLTDSVHLSPYSMGWETLSEGLNWPYWATTMIGKKRLDHVHQCLDLIHQQGIPGDLIETGVWRGGCTLLMRAYLKAYKITDRKVWVADSFEGLPQPSAEYEADDGSPFHKYALLKVPCEQVEQLFESHGLLDEQVVFLKGFFKDTLPSAPIEKLALMRLDGDMYESTLDALTHLYPRLSPGGVVIIDDWGDVSACRQAVQDYFSEAFGDLEIEHVNASCVYWRKP